MGREVAAHPRHRFFHWELEFPDVFREEGAGFDAVLGNPPWDIAKPVSMEFFSNIDPLYRSYGKQEALRKQTEYFEDEAVERGLARLLRRLPCPVEFCGPGTESIRRSRRDRQEPEPDLLRKGQP